MPSGPRTRSALAPKLIIGAAAILAVAGAAAATMTDPASAFVSLMSKAADHAKQHHDRFTPALSPEQATVLGENAPVQMQQMRALGVLVVPWTVNDPARMRELIDKHVDGLISDRPDLLMTELRAARARAAGNAAELAYLDRFDAQAHRGGRGLRPENTLPSFESGMDQGITTLETDTGVTTDHQSLIWHDQFLNPQSCRRADGQPYTLENRQYIRDISMPDAQQTFICDKLHFGADQKNDLALSPVAVAFAAHEKLPSPYAPTNAAQLFRFARFYAEYYRTGAGRNTPDAAARAHTGEHVHFNLETKIVPAGVTEAGLAALATGQSLDAVRASGKMPAGAFDENHTVAPELFVSTLAGAIQANHMEARADVQSFDFRTLLLIQEQYPAIRTYYLTGPPATLGSDLLPPTLRATQ
ncbi:glycerophosphodiester phosphodiesterase family protein [Acidipila sp. EB88]|uniref:glycerophosphodiester phosphodiesterase family protein n=1 Tax=Acidipila sp. EB88 TaxID=2305226 RepID=UPI000F5F46EF|nr:glycerophosphodiester phosphodiesterase family protein [Acidipila sp. EB88]RRA47550.1 glycerophosphodiester phosphodiesterase [Acidipila sp. EB88]